MGVSSQEIVFDANAVKLLAQLRKIGKAQAAVKKEIDASAKAAKAGSKEAQEQLVKQADKLTKLTRKQGQYKEALNQTTNRAKILAEQERKAAREAEKARREAEKAARASMKGFEGIATMITGRVMSATMRITDAQIEYNNRIAEGARSFDVLARKTAIQADFSNEEFRTSVKKNIAPIAAKLAISDLDQVLGASKQLSSQGFSAKQAQGSALEESLRASIALNTDDTAGVIRSITSILRARGQALTGENVRKEAVRQQTLFANTPFEAADSAQVGKVIGQFESFGLSSREAFASTTALKEQTGSVSEGVTGIRSISGKFRNVAGNARAMEALKVLGLSPDDINFSQGGFVDALETVKGSQGFQRLSGPARSQALTGLVGEEQSAKLISLLRSTDRIREISAFQQSGGAEARFQRSVATGTSGIGAASRQQKLREQLKDIDRGEIEAKFDLVFKKIRQKEVEDLGGGAVVRARAAAQDKIRRSLSALGKDPFVGDVGSESKRRVRESIAEVRKELGPAAVSALANISQKQAIPKKVAVKRPKFDGPAGTVSFDQALRESREAELTDEDRAITAADAKLADQRLKLGRARVDAEADGRVSGREQKMIENMERLIRSQEQLVKEMRARNTGRQKNRNAGARPTG